MTTKKPYFRTKPDRQAVHRAAIMALPAYLEGRSFTSLEVGDFIGKTKSCASHLLRQMVADGVLAQRRGNNQMLYSRPVVMIRRPWVARDNGIRLGCYFGHEQECAA